MMMMIMIQMNENVYKYITNVYATRMNMRQEKGQTIMKKEEENFK